MTPRITREALAGPPRAVAAATLPPLAAEPVSAPSLPPKVAAPVAGADALDCPAHLLAAMPVAVTLDCALGDRAFAVTTWRSDYQALVAAGQVVLVGGELEALALAAAHERAYSQTLAGWLERKAADPAWRLTLADALGECVVTGAAEPWTIGRLFGRLGVSLLAVRMET